MPRKTKEQTNEQLDIEKKKTTKKAIDNKKSKTAKKSTTKKTTPSKEVKTTKKTTKTSIANEENKTTRKASPKKVSTKEAKSTKITTKPSTEKVGTKKETKTTAKTVTKKASSKKSKAVALPVEVEYYDLPYQYNETVVKVLYQNPTTLFVYWEISNADIENYKKMYGKNFFETTEPILTVYNDSMNYKFEVVINDFANSWYFNINDSECDYHVELGRRPKHNKSYEENYIYITSSNDIESPNNRILYNTNEDNSVYFKNIKNNESTKIQLQLLIDKLNLKHSKMGFPLIKNLSDIYKNIFKVQDVYDLNKISNPSSESLSSRLK